MKRTHFAGCFLSALLLVAIAPAQTDPAQSGSGNPPVQKAKPKSTADFIHDVVTLISKHYPSKEALRAGADRLAKSYSEKLHNIGEKVDWAVNQVTKKFESMSLREKLALAMELWRIRSSLDLLCLCSPEVIHSLTGLDVPDLKPIIDRFSDVEASLQKMLPIGKF